MAAKAAGKPVHKMTSAITSQTWFDSHTGVIDRSIRLRGSAPLDFAVSDSYFVVAHFHYVLAGTVLFEMFAGFTSGARR